MKNKVQTKKIFSGIVLLMIFLFLVSLPLFVVGEEGTLRGSGSPTATISNPLKNGTDNLLDLLKLVLTEIVMPIAAVVSVVYIIWAGFKYVTAQGNQKAIEEAHQNLLYALIGVGILLGATGISQVIQVTVRSLIN